MIAHAGSILHEDPAAVAIGPDAVIFEIEVFMMKRPGGRGAKPMQ